MSTEPSKASSSASSSPQEAPQPPLPVAHYAPPPYGGHYPPPGPYPPLYAYPVPDPAHHDPNNPNGASPQPVAPFFMAMPPPPPGMVYAYTVPPPAPGASSSLPMLPYIDPRILTLGLTAPQGYPFPPGMPAPQPPPKPKRKQVKMAVSNPYLVISPRKPCAVPPSPCVSAGVSRPVPALRKPPVGLACPVVLFRRGVIAAALPPQIDTLTVVGLARPSAPGPWVADMREAESWGRHALTS